MNETTRHPNRRQRLATEVLIKNYRPPNKRRTKVVKNMGQIDALSRLVNPPPKVILDLGEEKLLYTLTQWGPRWKYTVSGIA